MAFTGRDYHAAFEEACETLPYVTDKDEVRSSLEGIEWILWEAIRGVFFYAAVLIAWLMILPPFFFLIAERTWAASAAALGVMIVIAVALYWLLRLTVRLEISGHANGRRFGSGGLD
ncbi:hypothetical protein ACG873_21550 [Mesorhizobium sp. AaZ16]|uniref:hypothetical protein n=1 Tax=Mesorhizobium sp. AaZ16 TaxID=3402289 RepID=UPI00374EE59C